MWGRCVAVAAAALMATPGLAAPGSGKIIWVELCDAGHPGPRIPLPLRGDDGAPAKACHAACALRSERRQLGGRR
jgi:hypothetical protein